MLMIYNNTYTKRRAVVLKSDKILFPTPIIGYIEYRIVMKQYSIIHIHIVIPYYRHVYTKKKFEGGGL